MAGQCDEIYSTVEMTEASSKQSKSKEDEHVYGNLQFTTHRPVSSRLLVILKWAGLVTIGICLAIFAISGTVFFLNNSVFSRIYPPATRDNQQSRPTVMKQQAQRRDPFGMKPNELEALINTNKVAIQELEALVNKNKVATQGLDSLVNTNKMATQELEALVNTNKMATQQLRDQVEMYLRGDAGSTAELTEFFDVFHSGFSVWRLAFRGTAGIGQELYSAYINPQEEVEEECRKIPSGQHRSQCSSHYRNNGVMDTWGSGVDQVCMVFYVVHTVFRRNSRNNMQYSVVYFFFSYTYFVPYCVILSIVRRFSYMYLIVQIIVSRHMITICHFLSI